MITEASFYGGAAYTSSTATRDLRFDSERVLRVLRSTAGTTIIKLPDTTVSGLPPSLVGGPLFYIINEPSSSGSVQVQDFTGSVVATLTAGKCALVFLLALGGTWHALIKTVNTASNVGHSTTAALANIEGPATYANLDCFTGNCCDLAIANDNAPLDGNDGRDLVLAAMFQNPCEVATNQSREPVRAADFLMPSVVVVGFDRDGFLVDSTHPGYGTYGELSESFWEALYNNDRQHALPYDAAANGESRHWHHIRWLGTEPTDTWGWGAGALNVQRWIWKKTIQYGPEDNPTQYTMEIRFVLEQTVTVTNAPLNCTDPGTGVNSATRGAWGAIFHIYVFTNEIYPSFVDGNTYTPAGGGSAVSFTKNDPCAWGSANGVAGGGTDDKFCHPQLIIAAHLPTNFQSPCGINYIPPIDRETTPGTGYAGRNLEYCYTVGNGAPWCTVNNAPNAIAEAYGIKGNVVFGGVDGSADYFAAMTTGGDFPSSNPTEYVTIENGLGAGRTYLKPVKPGWDEAEGILDVAAGSSMSICLCTSGQDCANSADCPGGYWPSCEPSPCDGHPDEPFASIGGSHRCFHIGGSEVDCCRCCIATSDASASCNEQCFKVTDTYGDRNGSSSCDVTHSDCTLGSIINTTFTIGLEDYDMGIFDTTGLNRVISWLGLVPNALYALRAYDYVSTSVANLVQDIGTWTFNAAYVEPSGSAGATAVKFLLTYIDAGNNWAWYGVEETVTTEKAKSGTHGIGFGKDDGSNNFTGYGGHILYNGGTSFTAKLCSYSAGTETVLSSVNYTSNSNAHALRFRQHGNDIIFSATPSDGSIQTLTYGHACSYVSDGTLRPCLFSKESTASNCRFDSDWSIDDLVMNFAEVAASMGKDEVQLSFDAESTNGYGKCEETNNPDCGTCCTPERCNCTTWTKTVLRDLAVGHTGGDYVAGDNPSYPGDNPAANACNAENACGGSLQACDDCPSPFEYLRFTPPLSCLPLADEADSPKICRGLSYWYWSATVCP